MRVSAVEMWTTPRHSAIGATMVDRADFDCAHRAPLTRREVEMTDVFHAVFSHRPAWLNTLLIARNRFAAVSGLETSSDAEVLDRTRGSTFAVGDKIGGWSIFFLSDEELVAGRNNAHLDFRVSIMKSADRRCAIISTVCWAHGAPGRAYLALVTPFHRVGVKALISSAVAQGRL
jgi:hypothetical protein